MRYLLGCYIWSDGQYIRGDTKNDFFFHFCDNSVAKFGILHFISECKKSGFPNNNDQSCTVGIKDNTVVYTLDPQCDGYLINKCDFYVATFYSFF